MKILIITKYFSSIGGTEKYIKETSTRLAEKGHQLTVLSDSKLISSYLYHDRIPVYQYPILNVGRIEISPSMLTFIRKNRFDVVHFHTFETLCSFLRRGLSTPYFITTHGFTLERSNSVINILKRGILSTFVRNNFTDSKGIFCCSYMDKLNVLSVIGPSYLDRVHYAPPGITSWSGPTKNTLKKKYHIEGRTVVSEIARFTPQKGQMVLVQAIERMTRKLNQDVLFILAGSVTDKFYFSCLLAEIRKKGLSNRILILRDLTERQIQEIYHLTDLYVLPTFREGIPLSILEAWSAQCAVIASNVGGIPHILHDQVDGILVEPHDPISLSEAISGLVSDEDRVKKLAHFGNLRARREFSWDTSISTLLKCYDSILN